MEKSSNTQKNPSMTTLKIIEPSNKRERWSQRVYPEKICINPNCVFGKKFIPYDKRQEHCCTQCWTDQNNDETSEKKKTTYAEEKIFKDIDDNLEILYAEFFDGKFCLVHKEYFRLLKIDLRYFVLPKKNPATGLNILWLYKYGTEIHHQNCDWIYIYKRPLNTTK